MAPSYRLRAGNREVCRTFLTDPWKVFRWTPFPVLAGGEYGGGQHRESLDLGDRREIIGQVLGLRSPEVDCAQCEYKCDDFHRS